MTAVRLEFNIQLNHHLINIFSNTLREFTTNRSLLKRKPKKKKNVTRDEEECFIMIKGSIFQEDIHPKWICTKHQNFIQSDKYYMIPLIWGMRSQINRDKVKWWSTALRGRRNGEVLFNRHRISVLVDEKVVWMDGSDGITTMWMHIILLNCIFLNGEDGKFYIMCTLPQPKIIILLLLLSYFSRVRLCATP